MSLASAKLNSERFFSRTSRLGINGDVMVGDDGCAAMTTMKVALFAAALVSLPSIYCFAIPPVTREAFRIRPLFDLLDIDFDYSSRLGWNDFWRQAAEEETLEWHSSIPFSIQVGLVPSGSSCLIVGCGNSALPQALYEAHQGETFITCLDSSAACLQQLRHAHGETCPNMTYVCGDAIELSQTLQQDTSLPLHYDIILDKGLTDALLCGEGFDVPLTRLLTEASSVLTSNGKYVLISYRLSESTQEFLTSVGDQVGMTWAFNVEGSNDRVSVSIATKRTV